MKPFLPIVLISSSRTGSTAYSAILEKRFGFPRILHPYYSDRREELLNYHKKTKEYILKIHAYELLSYQKDLLEIIKPGYLISILRRDIVSQIASHYLATMTNTWIHVKQNNLQNAQFLNKVEIQIGKLLFCRNQIIKENNAVKEFPLKFHEQVFYEDLSFSDSEYKETPKPDNYEELKSIIEKILGK